MSKNELTNRAYLSLGTNLDPENNLVQAVARLSQFGRIVAASTVWQTKPVGLADQPDFLNAVVLLETTLTAQELREGPITQIEEELGRVRTENKNSARTIDIDIMLFNRDVLTVAHRRIPDQEVLERPFVAIPLAEIAQDYIHPETGQKLKDIATQFDPATERMIKRIDVTLPVAD
jgi:2-amino-4-hydroxy-6-hydroxymethyldihydropteridine diphosphokinase